MKIKSCPFDDHTSPDKIFTRGRCGMKRITVKALRIVLALIIISLLCFRYETLPAPLAVNQSIPLNLLASVSLIAMQHANTLICLWVVRKNRSVCGLVVFKERIIAVIETKLSIHCGMLHCNVWLTDSKELIF